MKLVLELRRRRVPQYLSAYVVASWGLIQFAAFLESRMLFSPQVVNLVTLALVSLLPSVLLLAWRHGHQGPDSWGLPEKVGLPLNIMVTVLLAFILVRIGTTKSNVTTESVTVADEDGQIVERAVPKSEYGRQVLINYFENGAGEEDAWLCDGIAMMLVMDLIQDPFIISSYPVQQVDTLQNLGYDSGFDLSLSKQRQLARALNMEHFTSGRFETCEKGWRLTLEVHESESGRMVVSRNYEGSDMLALVDEASRRLRQDLGVSADHIEQQIDLTVREILSENEEALRLFSEAMCLAAYGNDWLEAGLKFEAAVVADPEFALAQYMLFASHTFNGRSEEAAAAIQEALNYVYRLPERLQFSVKAVYYFNIKQDPDRAMAVTEMWIRLYPEDVSAYSEKAKFCNLRGDTEGVIAAMERIIEIAPYQHLYLLQLASLYLEDERYDEAEKLYQQYASLYPGKAESYAGLARLYSVKGRLEAARENFEQALLLESKTAQLMVDLAMIDRRLGRFESAFKGCEEALDIAVTVPEKLRALEGQANLNAVLGRIKNTHATLDLWHESYLSIKSASEADFQYGFLVTQFLTKGTAAGVQEQLEIMNASMIENIQPLGGLNEALAFAFLGELEAAQLLVMQCEDYINKYKYEAMLPYVNFAKAEIARQRGESEGAIQLLEQAIESMPTRVSWLAKLTDLYIELGRYNEAAPRLARMIELDPGRPLVRFLKAKLMKANGDFQGASILLAEVIEAWKEADSDFEPALEAKALAEECKALLKK